MLATLALPACRRASDEAEIASPDVPTIEARTGTVARRDLVERLVVRGTIVAPPNEDVKIAAQVAGRVVAMYVAEGDRVRAGQTLARIETQPLEDQRRASAAAVGQARAALDAAAQNLTRTEKLFERGIAAGKEVEDARAQSAAAESGAEQARTTLDGALRQLARAQVTTPIAGQVVRRFVGVGEQVDGTAAQPLVEVANLVRVEVAAQVPSEHIGAVREGMSAEVASDAYPGRAFEGRVIAIAPAVDPATNSALVRVAVENPERLLKLGMFAELRVALRTRPGALSVPVSALVRGEDGPAVYAVAGDLATRTPIKVGLETPEAVEVLSGLKQGQVVLVSSVHGLRATARLAAKP